MCHSRSCSDTATPESTETSAATVPVAQTSSSVPALPERLAFSTAECAGFDVLGRGETLEELVPLHAHDDLGPSSEYFAAAAAIGQAARDRFDSVVEAAESGEPPPAAEPPAEGLHRIERLVQASTSPALIASSAQLAERIEEECGANEVATALWDTHGEALFMQAIPPTGYCEALARFDLESLDEVDAHAPDAHRQWIEALRTADPDDESSLALVLGSGMKTTMYRSAQCGENLGDLLDISD
ncbi:MAG: hypothetical protein GY925_10235 [Actinomycetia bacterium]|nr:hypothetical protein [Actinomycetes bacterium]